MKKNRIPITFIVLQIVSIILYKRPQIRTGGYDAPVGFVELVMFAVFNLVLIGIFIILFFIRKESKSLIWKIPFVLFFILTTMSWHS